MAKWSEVEKKDRMCVIHLDTLNHSCQRLTLTVIIMLYILLGYIPGTGSHDWGWKDGYVGQAIYSSWAIGHANARKSTNACDMTGADRVLYYVSNASLWGTKSS